MKALRTFAALFVALTVTLLPLLVVTTAWANPLDDAQAALYAGQQELTNATLDKHDADALVASASQDVTDAQMALATAQAAYDASKVDYPAVTTTGTPQNVVVNGTFDAASNWTNIQMYDQSKYNNSSVALVMPDGTLKGSYSSGVYYQQTGTFSSPVRQVTFAVDVQDNDTNNGQRAAAYDYYRIEFRTYNAAGTRLNYYNLEYSGAWHDWTTRTATYSLSDGAVRWDVGFRLADGGYWNGNYGPSIDNVRVIAATTTTIPAHTTYGDAETAALAAAQSALTSAQTAYAAALVTQANAAARLQAASDAIPILEAAVLAATPATPAPAPWWAQQNWEGESVTITAPEGWEFYSVRAWYGSPDDWNCGADVSSVLGALMIGQHSVTLNLDNGTFGDPCGGVVKVTRLTWSIVPTSTPVPTSTATPQSPEPTATPTTIQSPEPSPTTTASPEPQPSQSPSDPTPVPVIPVVPPVVDPPVIVPQPQPQPMPFPVVEPVPVPVEPTPAPVVTPEPVATPEPQPSVPQSPSPEPVLTPEPTASASLPPQESTPEVVPPKISPSEPPVVEPTKDVSNIATVDLKALDPQELSTEQVAALVTAAVEVLATASEGSPQYEKALDALAVAAQADDPQVPEELASIPGVGVAAVAVLNAFNALGNFGADMSPAHRATAKKEVVAAIVLTQVTSAAVGAATSAASSPSSRKTK